MSQAASLPSWHRAGKHLAESGRARFASPLPRGKAARHSTSRPFRLIRVLIPLVVAVVAVVCGLLWLWTSWLVGLIAAVVFVLLALMARSLRRASRRLETILDEELP